VVVEEQLIVLNTRLPILFYQEMAVMATEVVVVTAQMLLNWVLVVEEEEVLKALEVAEMVAMEPRDMSLFWYRATKKCKSYKIERSFLFFY
jgi:hypothetical protein